MPKSNKNLQDKIFSLLLLFTLLISSYFLSSGIIMRMTRIHHIKWIITILIIISLIGLNYKYNGSLKIRKAAFLLLIFFIIPFGWLSSASNAGFNIGYVFIAIMSIYYFYIGKERMFLVTTTIIIITLLMAYQAILPHHFVQYTDEQLIINTLIQVPLIFTVGVYMLAKYTDTLRNNNQMLETLSTHDHMTGIYNRRYIYNKLGLIEEYNKGNQLISIGFLDIDYFKEINDTYGHDVGDKVISSIANHIKSVIGEYGIVGRYGGDEFIVILENYPKCQYKTIINSLNILDTINNKFSLEKPLSLSGGFTDYKTGTSMDKCLDSVDKRLYQAKHQGRNQIIID